MAARIELWNGISATRGRRHRERSQHRALDVDRVGGALKRRGGDSIEYAAVRQAPVPLGAQSHTRWRTGGPVVIHAVSLDVNRRTSGRRSPRPCAARWTSPATSAPRAWPSRPSHRHRRLPARRGRDDHRGRRPRGPAAYRTSTMSCSPCVERRPTRRSRRPSRRRSPAASGSSSDRASDVTGGAAGRAGRAARARDPAARLTTPAVHFLQASRPYRPLGANAMLFFDPVLSGFFGGELATASESWPTTTASSSSSNASRSSRARPAGTPERLSRGAAVAGPRVA